MLPRQVDQHLEFHFLLQIRECVLLWGHKRLMKKPGGLADAFDMNAISSVIHSTHTMERLAEHTLGNVEEK